MRTGAAMKPATSASTRMAFECSPFPRSVGLSLPGILRGSTDRGVLPESVRSDIRHGVHATDGCWRQVALRPRMGVGATSQLEDQLIDVQVAHRALQRFRTEDAIASRIEQRRALGFEHRESVVFRRHAIMAIDTSADRIEQRANPLMLYFASLHIRLTLASRKETRGEPTDGSAL